MEKPLHVSPFFNFLIPCENLTVFIQSQEASDFFSCFIQSL